MFVQGIVAGGVCASEGLIAYYDFEDGFRDRAGNHDGTGKGKVEISFAKERDSNVLNLLGKAGYVDCGNSADFDIAEAITVMAWVNLWTSNY